MITLLNQFTEKYGIKAKDLFASAEVKDETHKRCLMVIAYMLFDVYELKRDRVSEIINRSSASVSRYTEDVQIDFEENDSKLFGKMFDELLAVLEDAESKGIKVG